MADGKDRHDIGMVQLRGGQPLVLESRELPRVEHRRKRQDLEGHAAFERNLFRFIHHAHATPADLADDAKVA